MGKYKEIIEKLTEICEEADRMRNAYFFEPPKRAAERRDYEWYHSHPEISWEEGGHVYTAQYGVSCSCKYIYARGYYTKDGEKTNLKAIKSSLERLKKMNPTE